MLRCMSAEFTVSLQKLKLIKLILIERMIPDLIHSVHQSLTMRGIKKPGSKTVTTVTRGEFKENMELQKQFL